MPLMRPAFSVGPHMTAAFDGFRWERLCLTTIKIAACPVDGLKVCQGAEVDMGALGGRRQRPVGFAGSWTSARYLLVSIIAPVHRSMATSLMSIS